MSAAVATSGDHGDSTVRAERLAFVNGIRLWSLGVRIAARELVSLGRPYEVQFTRPTQDNAPLRLDEFADLGFDLVPLFGCHVIQVKDVMQTRARLPARVTPLHNAPPCATTNGSPLTDIQPDDFLVSVNGEDLLLAPVGSISQLRKFILGACNSTGAAGEPVVTLRFVRLDPLVHVDATRQLTHGCVLEVLDTMEKMISQLSRDYDVLLMRNRAAVTQRLTRQKKLFDYIRHLTQTLRAQVNQDERYQMAARLQSWYVGMLASRDSCVHDDDDDEDDDEDDDAADEGDQSMDVYDIDDDDDQQPDEGMEDNIPDESGRAFSKPAMVPQSAAAKTATAPRPPETQFLPTPLGKAAGQTSQPVVATRQTLHDKLHALGVHNLHMKWDDDRFKNDSRWLPQSKIVLENYMEGLIDGFISDGFWSHEMETKSRSIAEHLVATYAAKLRASRTMSNADVKKEFAVHARKLRANIANAGNKQLRADILSGTIDISTLCAMTSEQLAPEALQAERQRRYEQHVREVTLPAAPSGPIFVKTKNGLKEVVVVGATALAALHVESAAATTPAAAVGAIGTTSSITTTAAAASDKSTDEVTERLGAMEVNRESDGPPTVSMDRSKAATTMPTQRTEQLFPPLPPGPPPPIPATAPPLTRTTVPPVPPPVNQSPLDTAKFTVTDSRAFLRAMFDPAQDLEATIHQLQNAIYTTQSLATMSHEFILASGVSLYRDLQSSQTRNGSIQFRARVRVLHWTYEQIASNDRDATMSALGRLVNELKEFRRLFGDLLDALHQDHNCLFPQPSHNRDAHRCAINLAITNGLRTTVYKKQRDSGGSAVDVCRVSAEIDRMELAFAVDGSQPVATDRALHDVVAFFSDLVALKYSTPSAHGPTVVEDHQQQQQHHRLERDTAGAPVDTSYAYEHAGDAEPSRYAPQGSMDRKRPLSESDRRDTEMAYGPPPVVRRKTEEIPPPLLPPVTATRDSSGGGRGTQNEEPVFFVDAKGEANRPAVDAISPEQRMKNQVDAYQQLVRELFRDYNGVIARLGQLDWDPSVPEKTFEFTSRLNITRKITRTRNSSTFLCDVRGLEGNLHRSSEDAPLSVAVENVMRQVKEWLFNVYTDWSALVSAYTAIMKRKEKQRGNQADARLSAANETRRDRLVSSFVREQERPVGGLHEYTIHIRSHVAHRQVCMNTKMAKRAAGEDFQDLIEALVKMIAAKTRPPAQATPAPAKAPRRPSNRVVGSDDSDDDDDDDSDDEYDDGGGYSDDAGHESPTKPEQASASSALTTGRFAEKKYASSRLKTVLEAPYPLDTERGKTDDAKMRAIIRSLFTPEDNLCSGISRIRGALKYQGHHHTDIIPNVTVSIRLDLVGRDTFDVHASLNDILKFTATAYSKQAACDKAVDGLLDLVDTTRRTWVQLLHFFHHKEMANNDYMESFNALRLANITKIETRIEAPPTGFPSLDPPNRRLEAKMAMSDDSQVHCVLYVGGKPVYRVNEAVEQDAHTMATARTARFFIDLIDAGRTRDEDKQDPDFQPMRNVDWHCVVQLQDFGDRSNRVEFMADACWALADAGRVPHPSTDFALPTRVTFAQIGRIAMGDFEQSFGSPMDRHLFYFRVEATYENGKFVNKIASYGNKNKFRAFVLELEVVENNEISVFIFPPGASVNSESNLYISHKVLPKELSDRKAVYGIMMRRHLTHGRHGPVP